MNAPVENSTVQKEGSESSTELDIYQLSMEKERSGTRSMSWHIVWMKDEERKNTYGLHHLLTRNERMGGPTNVYHYHDDSGADATVVIGTLKGAWVDLIEICGNSSAREKCAKRLEALARSAEYTMIKVSKDKILEGWKIA